MTLLTNIRSVLFDYGGTLDTDGRHWSHVLREGWNAAGLRATTEHFRAAYVAGERTLAAHPVIEPGDNFATLLYKKVFLEIEALANAGIMMPIGVDRERAICAVVAYCDMYARRNILSARHLLEALRRQGLRLVLVTNFYGNMHAVLSTYGMLNLFDDVVESAVVGVRKPDPAIYRLGLKAAGTAASETLVVGDSYGKDIVPAKTIGCHAVWLRGQGWGPDAADLDESLPDAIIHHLCELKHLLE